MRRHWKHLLLVAVVLVAADAAGAAETKSLARADKSLARADKSLARADERFASAETTEVPSLQRHVLPLMGRLGCNGRACHGSFQGQGGFRLSLFGYDFKTDHEALVKSETPRVDLAKVRESMILAKPSSDDPDEHGGGKRMDVDSWQYRLIEKWVAAGAPAVDEEKDPHFIRMVVTPTEIVFGKMGESTQLKVVAEWSDGAIEDVTPLCRFQTRDDAVAKVDLDGKISSVGKGDTHVVAFYDNGVVPVSVMLAVSDQVGPKYPEVATKTKVDTLVVDKLKKIGVVPADVCTDHEFLRRASLDITGQMPSADEVKAFLADKSPTKRTAKVDELLERPGYAAWWATRLNDILGNSENKLRNNTHPTAGDHWYRWVHRRVAENVPYDDIVAGILLAQGRSSEGQSFEEYCKEMTSYVRSDNPEDFTARATMPYYWMRQNMRTANEKALSVSYAFLGVRLQCAECHKHPFDQWSQQDFQQFTAFFNRVSSGPSRDKEAVAKLLAAAKIDPKEYDTGNKLRQVVERAAVEGKVVPFNELYINGGSGRPKGNKDKGKMVAGRVITPKVLGGDEVVEQTYSDPREPIMDWLRQKDNPYFARSFVNRVWAHYFNVGIVEPADDMNLANAPSNTELLDYLADAFVEHDYDMKWLMREIVNSDTYQRSWQTNSTNEYDLRNFSHAVMRRLPAEVVYDAVVSATAGKDEFAVRAADPVDLCMIGVGKGYTNRNNSSLYALTVFGKPKRETPCDCERSNEPSLLQTVYLRNDQEMFKMITRNKGWLSEALESAGLKGAVTFAAADPSSKKDVEEEIRTLESKLDSIQAELRKSKDGKKERGRKLSEDRKEIVRQLQDLQANRPTEVKNAGSVAAVTPEQLIDEAYLRTFGRYPTAEEKANGLEYVKTSTDLGSGLRDLVWALLNSKEFVVNH